MAAVYESMVKELDCVGKSERHLFSAVLAFLSLSNISEDFDLTFLQTFFYPTTFANNYFVFLDPQKKFFKISHSSVQKNNSPSFTMFLPCSRSINSLPGSFNYKNIFFSRKIAFFILSKLLSTLCY